MYLLRSLLGTYYDLIAGWNKLLMQSNCLFGASRLYTQTRSQDEFFKQRNLLLVFSKLLLLRTSKYIVM